MQQGYQCTYYRVAAHERRHIALTGALPHLPMVPHAYADHPPLAGPSMDSRTCQPL